MKTIIFPLALLILVGVGCTANQSAVQTPPNPQPPLTEQVVPAVQTPPNPQPPLTEQVVPVWKLALGKLPDCAARKTSESTVPDNQTLDDLGLQNLLEEGYDAARVCIDAMGDRVVFILAKQDLKKFAPTDDEATCWDRCDKVVFGTIDVQSGLLAFKRSTNKLGLYSESYNQYCLVDKVVTSTVQTSDTILFYCGSGESGGLTDWYKYELANDKLTTVQSMTWSNEPKETFKVNYPDILKIFRYKSNAEMRYSW